MRRRGFTILLAGAMAGWRPSALRAQQKTIPVIGFLSPASSGPYAPFVAAVRQGLSETGYLEGQNLAIEYRWGEGRHDRMPTLAADLAGRKVDVILALGDSAAAAAKNATSTVPIAFVTSNAVETGLVASLARPEGNLTGISILAVDLMSKRVELISDLVPQASVIALLANPDAPFTEAYIRMRSKRHAQREYSSLF